MGECRAFGFGKKEDAVFMKVKATTVTREDFVINVPI